MIRGKVIAGDGYGKVLGYPTANLDIDPEKTFLKDGVYAARALFQEKEYGAALVVCRPKAKVEVFLLEYTGADFYGEILEVDAVQKISEIDAKHSEEELREKIGRDITIIREILYGTKGN